MSTGPEPAELVVVDASIVVALVATRAGDTRALAERLDGCLLHAPTHLAVEVDSALRGLERGRRLTQAQAEAARAQAAGLPIDLWSWSLVADRAWDLRHVLTSYDAGYVALAERLGATLLTGDARLARSGVVRCPIEVAPQ
ncbi:type II toxin-antitoxin system VapC family toxin [Microbacterium sp. bgisy203]|uniref:type II toxin-antitoxin system VapC family toxin n=1 Tax=Microbacterium sp. bgisy203 TaxID=3413799 RepID=UPI003D73BD72